MTNIRILALASILGSFLLAHPLSAGAASAPSMTVQEAAAALKEGFPDVNVLEVNSSPIEGLFEIMVEQKGQKGIIYLDSSRKHIFSGSIVEIAGKKNITQERFSEISKIDVSQIPIQDAIAMGDKGAPKKVIVFTDPD